MVMFLLSFDKGSKSAEGGPNPLGHRQHSSMSFFFSRHRFYIGPSLLLKVAAFGAFYFRRFVILVEPKKI